MAQSVGDYFGSMAERYDSIARRGMPRYEEMLDKILEVAPERAGNILELGCGTGALTLRLRARFPIANLRAIDAAPEMLDLAQERLREAAVERADEVDFDVGRFGEFEMRRQSYDLITGNMSLHHLKDKGPFYAQLWEALKPGGVLVFGDELKGELPYVEDVHWNGWLEFARQPNHLTEQEIAEIIRHVEAEDHYETLTNQLSLLRKAGFVGVDCTWRFLNYAVFVAST
jgi:tRNA (cmo5U34)-methyltransferase